METFHFSPDLLRSLAWLLALLAVDYLGVIVAVCVDLHSGLRKASRLGQPRTSRGYRRTVDKGLRYLATLLSLTLVDVIMSAVGHVSALYDRMEHTRNAASDYFRRIVHDARRG